MQLPIYLDNMATTPLDPQVLEKMRQFLADDSSYGNPSSRTHSYGWKAATAVEEARAQVAALINADSEEIIWTSGGTEANNLAIIGLANFYQRQGRHIITCKTEHKSVLDPFAYLQRQGFEVTWLSPQTNGLIDLQSLEQALRPDTLLVSIMQANSETGVLQDIAAIGQLTRSRGIIFHVDAIQGAGKIPIDVKQMQVDAMSLSAHKIYGPKGIGALYLRRQPRLRLQPLMYGGGQEKGLRPGTLATHQIVAMGEAFRLAGLAMPEEGARLLKLRQRLLAGISALPIQVHGDLIQRLPGNLYVSFLGSDATGLISSLQNLAVSTGSACSSGSIEPSYVLLAMGVSPGVARSALRFSLGRFTQQGEIDFAVEEICRVLG